MTKTLCYACKENCVCLSNSISHGAVIVPSEDCWYIEYIVNDDDDDDSGLKFKQTRDSRVMVQCSSFVIL